MIFGHIVALTVSELYHTLLHGMTNILIKDYLIIGVHSPEFEFEKNPEMYKKSIDKHGINYPVVMDNDMETWKAFENRYWPRKYIADHEGYIRYDHIGEGGYQETEKVIQLLIKERSDH